MDWFGLLLTDGWPWIAALGYPNPENKSEIFYGCGGTLITDQHIITAGHCINAPEPL
jgi:V8-like Glu-specific endopeptidase